MPQSFACLRYHVIFSTRDRHPGLTPEIRGRLYPYISGILRAEQGQVLVIGGTADHVHLLLGISRDRSVVETVRDLKANSSRWIRSEFPSSGSFSWQAGYGAFTVGRSGVANVRAYIENQEEHHRTKTFQEEFVEFLCRYEIPFDERYLWE